MSLTAYPTLRLKLTMPQALKLQFLPAIPGSNAATAAAAAIAAAAVATNAANNAIAASATKVDKSGDIMTGSLTLNGDPSTALQAATKQYVDMHGGSSGGVPEAPFDGILYGRMNATWSAVPIGTGTGNVSTSGTITFAAGEIAQWASATTIKSITGTADQVLRANASGVTAFGAIDLSKAATVGTSDLAFANLTQGSARSVLGVTGNATADVASVQGTTDQVLRINGAGTALAFGQIDLSKTAAVTGQLVSTSFPILTGDVTTAGGLLTTTISAGAVSYAKQQNITAASLLIGRGSAAGAGVHQEIALGTNLSMSGTTLNATGGGSGGVLGMQVFTTAGTTTYLPTVGMQTCIIECCGGGGGGGGAIGSTANTQNGGGGGGGGYSRAFKTAAQIGASQSVTVGAAGAGGASSSATGGNGGDSYVGATLATSLCGAKGGSGGGRCTSAVFPLSGAGGSPTTAVGDIKAGGSPGGPGYQSSQVNMSSAGSGGTSFFGGGALGAATPAIAGGFNGTSASGYGSGGGAGVAFDSGTATGGAGSAGIIVITEFK